MNSKHSERIVQKIRTIREYHKITGDNAETIYHKYLKDISYSCVEHTGEHTCIVCEKTRGDIGFAEIENNSNGGITYLCYYCNQHVGLCG